MLMLVIMSCHSYPGHTEQAGNSLVANRSVIEMYWINIGILKMCIQSGTTPGIIYFCVQIFTKTFLDCTDVQNTNYEQLKIMND